MSGLFALNKTMLRCLPILLLAVAVWAADQPAAAVLASVDGAVKVTLPDRPEKEAVVFDWLPAGTSLQTGGKSHALVILADGRRFEVAENSRIQIATGKLEIVKGTARPKPGLTEIPKLAAIEDRGAKAYGLSRVRGAQVRYCYPSPEVAILASPGILSFDSSGALKYRVEVLDAADNVIYREELTGTVVTLPADLLKPGARYSWAVRAVTGAGEGPPCGADFFTLSAEEEQQRAVLAAAVKTSGSADELAILAEVDRRLALLREAKDEFTAALDHAAAKDAIRSAITAIDEKVRPK